MVDHTVLSRGTERKALRTVATEGLVKTRHTRVGGSVVTPPGKESLADVIDRFVQGRKLSLRTLQEIREALEALLARRAAE